MEFSKLYGELKTLESALTALRKCEIRLSITLGWIKRFHGKVPDGLRVELKAADNLKLIAKRKKPEKPAPTRVDVASGPTRFLDIDETENDDNDSPDSPPSASPLPAEKQVEVVEWDTGPSTPIEDEDPEIEIEVPASPPAPEFVETASGSVKIVDLQSIIDPNPDPFVKVLILDEVEIKEEPEPEPEPEVHKCSYCSVTFASIYELSVHALMHSKVQTSRMGISKKSMDLITQQPRRYSIRKLNNKLVVCEKKDSPKAPANLEQWKRKKLHRAASSAPPKSKCHYCPQSFPSENALSFHLTNSHHHPSPCEVCNLRFTSGKELDNHMLEVHPEYEPYKCRLCDKLFNGENKLNKHMSRAHPHPSLAKTCNVCGKTFKGMRFLLQHKRNVHASPELARTCDVCGIVCKNELRLKHHQAGVHVEKTVLCQICGWAMKTKAQLQMHTKLKHEPARPYKCTYCPHDFKSSAALARHVSRHLGTEGKKCPYCGLFKSEMYNHITIVHKGRKFKCAQCPRMFSLRAHVKNHYVLKHPDVPMPADSEFEVVYTKELGNPKEVPEGTEGQREIPESPVPPSVVAKKTKIIAKKVQRAQKAKAKSKSGTTESTSALSCSVCDGAVFNSKQVYELHLRMHEKDPDYKLKHRIPVKRVEASSRNGDNC